MITSLTTIKIIYIHFVVADVYHLLFNPPKSTEIASRLVEEPGGIEVNMHANLTQYHRHSRDLLSCYSSAMKSFNIDQPLKDLFEQGERKMVLGR